MAATKKRPPKRRKKLCKGINIVDQILKVVSHPVVATAAAFVFKEVRRSRRRHA